MSEDLSVWDLGLALCMGILLSPGTLTSVS
jgi:hypothetical protein